MSENSKNSATGPEASKAEVRALALERRRELAEKDGRSQAVCERFCSLPAFSGAETCLVYMHVRHEVRTNDLVGRLLGSCKRVVVPYCLGDNLKLFHLAGLDELSEGAFGILEPREHLRSDVERRVEPGGLDLLAVPGVAFDRFGGRVGHGGGYFDRLLKRVRADAVTVGLAFECQLFDRVPMDSHDVPLDVVVTEDAAYSSR